MNKVNRTLTYLINACFLLYFLILLVERFLSIILTKSNGINIYSDAFDGFAYTLIVISILGWLAYFFLKCHPSLIALFKTDDESLKNIPFNNLCIASGIILISGMVHSHYTISIVQFISYGILIIGILLKVILNGGNKLLKWMSFSYLVAFSMAIPVTYHSFISLHVLFHITSGIASVALVGVFTYLLLSIFDEHDNLFILWPIFIATILDAAIIVLRWKEEINYFVLIFLSLSIVLFIIGYILSRREKISDVRE